MSFIKTEIIGFLQYISNIKNYSQKTVLTYQISLDKIFEISEVFEENDIWILDINKFRLASAKNLKTKTISKDLSALKSFAKYLRETKKLKIKVIGANNPRTPKTLPKPINFESISDVLCVCNEEQKMIIELIYALGLRVSEIAKMRLEDISNGWVNIFGKGSKQRQIPLLPNIEEKLKQYIKIRNPKIYIFEKNGEPFSVSQFQYRVKKSFAQLGIDASPHKLRHSFATHLLNEGARINDVSELLGHSNIGTTNIYTKLSSTKKYNDYFKAHPLNRQNG